MFQFDFSIPNVENEEFEIKGWQETVVKRMQEIIPMAFPFNPLENDFPLEKAPGIY